MSFASQWCSTEQHTGAVSSTTLAQSMWQHIYGVGDTPYAVVVTHLRQCMSCSLGSVCHAP